MDRPTVKAKLTNLPLSPQKVRLVADVVRGKKVEESLEMLRFLNKSAALPVAKLINSAVSNAEENNKWPREDLFISKIMVGDGIRRRWRRSASRGRINTIYRKYCNIEVEIQQKSAGLKTQEKSEKKVKEVKSESKVEEKVEKTEKLKAKITSKPTKSNTRTGASKTNKSLIEPKS